MVDGAIVGAIDLVFFASTFKMDVAVSKYAQLVKDAACRISDETGNAASYGESGAVRRDG